MRRALVIAVVVGSTGIAAADPDIDLDVGMLGGYTWTDQGQVTMAGPQIGIVEPLGPLQLRGEYAYVFWNQDYGHIASGREHWIGASVQLDIYRANEHGRRTRAFLEAGAAEQRLSIEAGHEVNHVWFAGAGYDFRGRVVTTRWPDYYGLVMSLRIARGPSILPEDCMACARMASPPERGHDWAMLMLISNGLSW